MKTKLEQLEEIFNIAIRCHDDFVYVEVALPNLESPEVILNPIENAEDKLKYYKATYNDDLVMKNNPDIRIVGYGLISNGEEISVNELYGV